MASAHSASAASGQSELVQPQFERDTADRVPLNARDFLPVAGATGILSAGALVLRRRNPAAALKTARFLNLLLGSLLTGNSVGASRFVHPALRSLAPRAYLEAEQAITRRYPGTMLAAMPATVASGLLVLALLPRQGRPLGQSFWLTLGGTLSCAGVLATTFVEVPMNKQTLEASLEAPEAWLKRRPRWERFNYLRTLLAVTGWCLLCFGALSEESAES